jgi:hexosaminidase
MKNLFACLLAVILTVTCSAQFPTEFKVRGYHVDLRLQVLKMPALKALVQNLKDNGINTLVMEWEATYPFSQYPIIANRYAYTKQEVNAFMSFCDSLDVDVVPLQQSFGHVEYILRDYKFASLREDQKDYSQVCPVEEEGNRKLFTELFAELAATHKSSYFHIGGDETYLLGHCEKCKKKAAEVGLSKLYIDHIKMLCEIVLKLGKKPILWADIALKHPEAIAQLPKQTVFIDWNYGWDLNRFGNLENLLKAGYEIWGAPAIRSGADNFYLSQWPLHFNNLHDFVPASRKLGYTGMVLTSWATNGIFNPAFNNSLDIIENFPRGHRYPITGYNMLLQAFFKSIHTAEPLDIRGFATSYGQKTFGLNAAEAGKMFDALYTAPYEIVQGRVLSPTPTTIQQVLDSTQLAFKTLSSLRPIKGKEEFAHLLLMTEIRLQFLETYLIENKLNEATSNGNEYPAIAARLKVILARSKSLDKRFIDLNKRSYYLGELQSENSLRSHHLTALFDRVSRNRNFSEQPAYIPN